MLTAKSEITKKILADCHLHGEGLVSTYARVLTSGFLVIRGKVVLKKIMMQCVKCLKFKLIPSQASLGRDETALHSNSKPMQISYLDLAGPWSLPVTTGSRTRVKVWLVLTTCSWTRFVKIQPLTIISAKSVLEGVTVSLASIGCGIPKVIASDQGSQLMKLHEIVGDAELDKMSDVEYNKFKYQLVKQGVILRNTTALSPWKTGKCER